MGTTDSTLSPRNLNGTTSSFSSTRCNSPKGSFEDNSFRDSTLAGTRLLDPRFTGLPSVDLPRCDNVDKQNDHPTSPRKLNKTIFGFSATQSTERKSDHISPRCLNKSTSGSAFLGETRSTEQGYIHDLVMRENQMIEILFLHVVRSIDYNWPVPENTDSDKSDKSAKSSKTNSPREKTLDHDQQIAIIIACKKIVELLTSSNVNLIPNELIDIFSEIFQNHDCKLHDGRALDELTRKSDKCYIDFEFKSTPANSTDFPVLDCLTPLYSSFRTEYSQITDKLIANCSVKCPQINADDNCKHWAEYLQLPSGYELDVFGAKKLLQCYRALTFHSDHYIDQLLIDLDPNETKRELITTFKSNIYNWFHLWIRSWVEKIANDGFVHFCVKNYKQALKKWYPLAVIFMTLSASLPHSNISRFDRSAESTEIIDLLKQLLPIILGLQPFASRFLAYQFPIKEIWIKVPRIQGSYDDFQNIVHLHRAWSYIFDRIESELLQEKNPCENIKLFLQTIGRARARIDPFHLGLYKFNDKGKFNDDLRPSDGQWDLRSFDNFFS